LNDFCDVRIDRINKPKRPIPSGRVSRRQALIFSLILLGGSVQLGYRVNQTAFLIVVGVVSTLVAYAFWLKRTALIGNLVVGSLTALTFIAGGVAKGITREVFPLAIFAFLFTTAREIVKDLEDLPGDRAQSVATLPLLWGERRAISIALLLIGGGIIFSPIPYLLNWYSWIYLVLMIFGVDLVLVYLGFQLWTNPTQRNCARIQKWMKWNIFVGLLAACLGATV
jgi:geranylgeranylglycerol-phosphate geranylgeranyltransferase